jgi:hypothetical protein
MKKTISKIKIENIIPLNGMVLAEKITEDLKGNKKTTTTASGLILEASQAEALKEDRYELYKIISTAEDLKLSPMLAMLEAGMIVGADFNANKGIGVEDHYLLQAGSIKYILTDD